MPNPVILNNDPKWITSVRGELKKYAKLMGENGLIYDETGLNPCYNSSMIVYTSGGWVGNFNFMASSIGGLKINDNRVMLTGTAVFDDIIVFLGNETPEEVVAAWNNCTDVDSGHYIIAYYSFPKGSEWNH